MKGVYLRSWIPKVDPEPSQDFDIIQPVLQYPGDSGNYWSVRSWCVFSTADVSSAALLWCCAFARRSAWLI